MENFYYGHEYDNDGLKKRLNRLEKTIFKYKRGNYSDKRRFTDLYQKFKSQKTPFHTTHKEEQRLTHSEIQLISLMENRIFGHKKDYYPLEKRIADLEMAVLGSSIPGNISERFDNLSKKTPISIKGVRVTKNGQTIASYKPDYKRPPVPTSPHKDIYTPLEIEYDQQQGDYYSQIAKNSSGEILRWKDFPVYVYINANNKQEEDLSKMALEYWQKNVPIRITNNYQTANILIDWASRGKHTTVPIIAKENNKKTIKILINMLNAKEAVDQEDMLVYLMHQIGHSLGNWGHSDNPKDLMYPIGSDGVNDINTKKKDTVFYQPVALTQRVPNITQRDLNTLYRVYQAPTSLEKILISY